MDVSSATSILPQPKPTSAAPTRAEDRIEGNTPDNDGDKDDTVSASAAAQATTTTGSVGTQIDIIV